MSAAPLVNSNGKRRISLSSFISSGRAPSPEIPVALQVKEVERELSPEIQVNEVERELSPEIAEPEGMLNKSSRENSMQKSTLENSMRSTRSETPSGSSKHEEKDLRDSSPDPSDKEESQATPTTPVQASATKRKLSAAEKLQRLEEMQKRRDQKEREKKEKQELREKEKLERELKRKEEARVKEEQRKQKEAEKQKEKEAKAEEERKRKEEKEKQKEEERLKKEEKEKQERLKKEEDKKQKEEERKRKEDEKNELKRQKELERQKKEEEKNAELRKKEEKDKVELKKQQDYMMQFVKKKPKREPVCQESSMDFGFFLPFEIQEGVLLAPRLRVSPLNGPLLRDYQAGLGESTVTKDNLYLAQLRSGKHKARSSGATCPRKRRRNRTEIILDDTDEVECAIQPIPTMKLFDFAENERPAYYGTMRRKSTKITPRRPFAMDSDLDYDVDSDEEWEEERDALKEAENLVSEEEDEPMSDEDEEEDDFFVEDEEEVEVQDENMDGKKKIVTTIGRWIANKQPTRRPKKRIIGPFFSNQENGCPNALKALKIIHLAQDFEELAIQAAKHEDLGELVNKVPESMMPYLIKLVHGSVAKKNVIANVFYHLWDAKESSDETVHVSLFGETFLETVKSVERPKEMTKTVLAKVIGKISSWTRPPLLEQSQKICHYVSEHVRRVYKVLEGVQSLPNTSCCKSGMGKRKLSVVRDAESLPEAPPPKLLKTETVLKPKATPKNTKVEPVEKAEDPTPPVMLNTETPVKQTKVKTLKSWFKAEEKQSAG